MRACVRACVYCKRFRSLAKGHTEIEEGIYADDLAVIARSPGCLQQSLDGCLHIVSVNWGSVELIDKALSVLVSFTSLEHVVRN